VVFVGNNYYSISLLHVLGLVNDLYDSDDEAALNGLKAIFPGLSTMRVASSVAITGHILA
jgi:hypothetical protein